MSWTKKQGILISHDDHAVMDYFVNAPVVTAQLQAKGSVINVRIPVGIKFPPFDLLPAIGDEVEIGWDYERFSGYIYTLNAGDRKPMPETLPIEGDRAFNLTDILDSLK